MCLTIILLCGCAAGDARSLPAIAAVAPLLLFTSLSDIIKSCDADTSALLAVKVKAISLKAELLMCDLKKSTASSSVLELS